MVIVPLNGDIFRANVEGYIMMSWGNDWAPQWTNFVNNTLGEGIRIKNENEEEVNKGRAFILKECVLKLEPSFIQNDCQPLSYLYFLETSAELGESLFKALDALNDKHIGSVAFNGGNKHADSAVQGTGHIIQNWEREKLKNKQKVYIKQVTLVCPRDFFVRLIPRPESELLVKPVFRPASPRIVPLREGAIISDEGDIFRANVESYIIMEFGMAFEGDWEQFVKDTLVNVKNMRKDSGDVIDVRNVGKLAFHEDLTLFNNVLTLDPPVVVPQCEPLKYLYFLRKNSEKLFRGEMLREELFAALDELNRRGVKSVAFNGDTDRNPRVIERNVGLFFERWEREKREKKEQVNIRQVNLVCWDDYFYGNVHKPIFKPALRPSIRNRPHPRKIE